MAEENVLKEGKLNYLRGNYSAALAFFLSLPSDSGADEVEVAYYLGLCYSKLKCYDEAMDYLEQVVTSGGESNAQKERIFQCRYILAVIYAISGRRKPADFELKKLLESGYKPSLIYSSMAYLAWENEEVDEALEYYTKALDEDENNPTALNGLGYVLACENRDLTKALSCCKKALELEPESAACLDSLGYVYYKIGLYSEAKKFLERAAALSPGNLIIQEHITQVEQDRNL